ncbi:MAG TPA: helix-turn-helix domain-containing protein [Bacteroidia bacterium]|jgi:hypothetical protein|nr:helix-turn-helix domain-containing protein [Bacteroidia bacterium]
MGTQLVSDLYPICRILHPMAVHIGKIIKDALKTRKMDVTEFSKKINYTRSNAYKIFNKEGIDTVLLVKISKVLGENLFFNYLTAEEIAGYKNSKVKPEELLGALQDLKDTMIVLSKKKDPVKSVKKKKTKSKKR